MGKPLWTNARDNPNFSPYIYMVAVSIPFIFIFSTITIVMMGEHSVFSLFFLQFAYIALCIFVGVFFLHSHIFNATREFLIVWKNKVFVQIPNFNSGWRTIPRNKFKVDIFRYNTREDLDAPAEAPKIVLEKPYKGKVYFLFTDSLVSPKISGVVRHLILERDIRELINILKPRRVLKTTFAPVGGYAYAKVNLGSKFKELLDKILEVDYIAIAQGIYEDLHKVARAVVSVDDTLLALSLFKKEKEAAVFMEDCITWRIERYIRRSNILKIGDMWHPNTGKIRDYLGDAIDALAIFSILIFFLSFLFGPKIFAASLVVLMSEAASVSKLIFISYNGVMGDTRLRYYFGLFAGLAVDVVLGVLHLALPFIAVMMVGPVAALPVFFLYAYLAYSTAFTALNIAENLYRTGYIEYRKLAREWQKFIREEELKLAQVR